MKLSNRSLATGALVGVGTFPVVVVALHLVQRGSYHPLSEAISELALGRAGWLMWVAFCAAGTGALCLAALHRRLVTRSVAAPVLLALCAVLSYVSAAFHADGDGRATLHGQIHQTAGIVEFVLVIVAMVVSVRRFRRDARWQPLARPTLVWALASIGTFFLIPTLGSSLFGLAQRIFIATWLTWQLAVAAYARRLAVAEVLSSAERESTPAAVPART